MQLTTSILVLELAVVAVAAPARFEARGQYPFTQMVAFGDNLSDNGNGSVAHGVAAAGDPTNSIYGFNTWTDGPIMASYLAGLLGVPLLDYAYGHADGGSKFGATIDNAYTQSTANAPSSKDQIANYTSSLDAATAGDSLHFLWIGANDINLYHIGTAVGSDNSAFATDMSKMLAAQVQTLLSAGAKTVVVPNLYAKHISPSKVFYASNEAEYEVMGRSHYPPFPRYAHPFPGNAISGANTAIQSSLQQFGDKVIYYDVFSFMVDVWNNHESYNITHVGGEFCDGYSQLDWDLCVTDGLGNQFYWMQYLDMTTTIHKMIATELFGVIQKHFSGSGTTSTGTSSPSLPSPTSSPSSASASSVPSLLSLTASTKSSTISALTLATPTTMAAPSDEPEPEECEVD